MGSTRPTLVTCTLEVPRWSASSLWHSPPDCAAELVLHAQPSRLCAQSERQHLIDVRPRRRNHQSPDPHELEPHQRPHSRTTRTPTPTRLQEKYQDKRQRHEARVLSALDLLGFSASILPVFGSASLRASSRSFERRGAPSRPPPRTLRGGRENHSWPRSKEIIPPKRGPSFT